MTFDPDQYWSAHKNLVSQVIGKEATKVFQGQITSVVGSKYHVRRPENVDPDPIAFPCISPTYIPVVGDWVWCMDTQGGAIILARNLQPGDADIPSLQDGSKMGTNSIGSRALAPSTVTGGETGHIVKNAVGTREIATNSVTPTQLDRTYSESGHGHGSHTHGITEASAHVHAVADIPKHSHTYGYYWAADDGAGYTKGPLKWYAHVENTSAHGGWIMGDTGGGGKHDHGGTKSTSI